MAANPLVGRSEIFEHLDVCLQNGRGVLLAGPAGVGKTRLLDELSARRAVSGMHVERFVGTHAGRFIRLGSLISLVSETTSRDVSGQLAAVRQALLSRAASRALLLAVDDAHLLDDASLACVADLASRGGATVIGTIRTDEDIPETVTAMWTSDVLERVDIGPLDDDAAAAMAGDLLGGPLDPLLLQEIIERSGNNPLFIRELIRDGRSSGAIQRQGRQSRLETALEPGPRLTDVVRSRTRRLSATERATLEVIALGEPLAIGMLDRHEQLAVGDLERLGLARTALDGQIVMARIDHPLIGEAVRRDIATLDRVDILQRLVDVFERDGCGRPGDGTRAAGWCGDLRVPPPPNVANRAANEAIAALDLERAEALASDAADRYGRCDDLVTLAEIYRKLARSDEADACLQRALDVARSENDVALIVKRRAQLHAHQLGRPDLAVALLKAGAERLSEPLLIVGLEQIAAEISGMMGRHDDMLRAATHLLQHDDGRDPTIRRGALNNLVYAQVMLGQLDDIDVRIDECMSFQRNSPDHDDWTEVLWALRTGVFIQRGDLVSGERTLAGRVDERRDHRPTGIAAVMHLQLLLYRSSPAIFDLITTSVNELRRVDEFGALPIAAALSACALAQAGRVDEAEQLLTLAPDPPTDNRSKPFVARGRAAVLAMRGDVDRAAEIVIEAGRETIDSTNVIFGVSTLHDAVRFGRAGDVADQMRSALRYSSGSFTRLMGAEAVATRDEDGVRLVRIADAFHDLGAPLFAAEAFSRATHFVEPDSTEARLAHAKLSLLRSEVAPFLVAAAQRPVDQLTAREFDIAVCAASAKTSREIADGRYISVRTVDNHLRHVYRKLGVNGRSELGDALGAFVTMQRRDSAFNRS